MALVKLALTGRRLQGVLQKVCKPKAKRSQNESERFGLMILYIPGPSKLSKTRRQFARSWLGRALRQVITNRWHARNKTYLPPQVRSNLTEEKVNGFSQRPGDDRFTGSR